MNPQITTAITERMNARALATATLVTRYSGRAKPATRVEGAMAAAAPAVPASEREHRDSLEFLHKLVMG